MAYNFYISGTPNQVKATLTRKYAPNYPLMPQIHTTNQVFTKRSI